MQWDKYLTGQDRAVIELAGYGSRGGEGRNPGLLVIDVTYGFCGDRPEPILDSVKRFRNSSGKSAWEAAGIIARLIATARDAGRPIFYTRGTADPAISKGQWASKNSRTAEDSAKTHEIVPPIAPREEDVVLTKTKPSAFFGTPLASLLVDNGVDSLIVCGGTTSGCVRATVVDGFSLNYPMYVVAEATFDRIEVSHWVSLMDMELKYADVLDATQAASRLETGSHEQVLA